MFSYTDIDEEDGREYDIHKFGDIFEAAAFVDGLAEECLIMLPLDGVWMDRCEAKHCVDYAKEMALQVPDPGEAIELAVKESN